VNTRPGNEVLLVEDSETDIRLTREALRDIDARVNLHVVRDGVEAVEFLNQRGAYESVPRPALVLLDLNLPRLDGHEVLRRIKGSETLMDIPVCVLSTSCIERDVLACYQAHANCYLAKPVDFKKFSEMMTALTRFWLDWACVATTEGERYVGRA
jgi:CheY-like chemotaxis protein